MGSLVRRPHPNPSPKPQPAITRPATTIGTHSSDQPVRVLFALLNLSDPSAQPHSVPTLPEPAAHPVIRTPRPTTSTMHPVTAFTQYPPRQRTLIPHPPSTRSRSLHLSSQPTYIPQHPRRLPPFCWIRAVPTPPSTPHVALRLPHIKPPTPHAPPTHPASTRSSSSASSSHRE